MSADRIGLMYRVVSAESMADMERDIEKENTILSNSKGIKRTGVKFPYRPDYGTKRGAVGLQTN